MLIDMARFVPLSHVSAQVGLFRLDEPSTGLTDLAAGQSKPNG